MPGYHVIDAQRALELLSAQAVRVLDMRDARSYRAGHLPGAAILHDGLEQQLVDSAPRDAPVLVYCYRGVKSRDKAEYLARLGFEQVYMLQDGFSAWPRDAMETLR